ncbi:MAG: ATP-binding protein [Bacteroidales bacterium]|nr:ATP-binding protein [Bacteroidales bacterium]
MLYRKCERQIEQYLLSDSNKILLVDGARQIGKTYIIRHVGKRLFKNFVEINFMTDAVGRRQFANVRSVEDFYVQIGANFGNKLKDKANTLIFLDEIQTYPDFLTLLKFLKDDDRYTYICSGSLLGVALMQTPSIPIGSVETLEMYPLDFEEFLVANGFNDEVLAYMRKQFEQRLALNDALHGRVMTLFREYLLTGGLPDAVNSFLADRNIVKVRRIQAEIHKYYKADAARYDLENRLKIQKVFELIPSNLENKKKRIVVKDIEGKVGKQFSDYESEFEYLTHAGVALDVKAVSNPKFPLIESTQKSLLKLYLNDVGILTNILYRNNINPILNDERSVNLGAVYETVVAQELKAHGHNLYYYDNKQRGEVDFLIDDYNALSVVPIEVKSGRDFKVHSAISQLTQNADYHTAYGVVLSNNGTVESKGSILYLPVYYVMWF